MQRPIEILFLLTSIVLVSVTIGNSQTAYHLSATFNHQVGDTSIWYPASLTGGAGPLHIRGVYAGSDLDQDGWIELIATDYYQGGRVHVFEAVGNDSIELVWSSPAYVVPKVVGTRSHPRDIRTGDLDGDGNGEIIFVVGKDQDEVPDYAGIYVYEWDGVTDNGYGDRPSSFSQFDAAFPRITVENIAIGDIDSDGQQELIINKDDANSATADLYMVYSVVGDIVHNGGGFEAWAEEKRFSPRETISGIANYLGGGSPQTLAVADLNGDGKQEVVFNTFSNCNIFVMSSDNPNSYVFNPDTSAAHKRYFRALPYDDRALMHLGVVDADNDGNDEVYVPIFSGAQSGDVFVIDYGPGDNVLEVDSTHVVKVASRVTDGTAFSLTAGDTDGDRLGNIFVSGSGLGRDLTEVKFLGGNVKDPLNYQVSRVYAGEPGDSLLDAQKLVIRDSAGVITRVNTELTFVAKLWTGPTVDLDRDGHREVVFGYQSIWDSVTYEYQHWNGSTYVVDSTVERVNTNRRILRVLESDFVTGVEVRDLVIVVPDDFKLYQNYPNPFNPSTTITFQLPMRKKVSLRIFDVIGKEVRTLVNDEEYPGGSHQVVWDGRNNHGESVGSGTYIYRLEFGNFAKSMKMVLVK